MRWLRNRTEPRAAPSAPKDEKLARLAEAGAEVVLFVPGCTTGCVCDTARMLDGGRIPLKLAEPTPVAECTNCQGCVCRYDAWPHLAPPSNGC